ncbi:MAG: XdhC family protein [Bacillota bacterium]
MNIMEKASELIKSRVPFAFVTVVASKGSTPRSAASKMLVVSDGSIFDTIGGGLVEAMVIEEAVKAIKEGKPKLLKYRLNSKSQDGINMLCGGDMDVFIDVYGRLPNVVIVGGGHVGYALSKAVRLLGWDYSVVEERPEYSTEERFPDARMIYRDGDVKTVAGMELDESTCVVILTKDHDMSVLRKVIGRGAGYIGMIGSRRKVAEVFEQLRSEGVSEEDLQNVFAPVGLDIGAETPEEIAVSILAEIIKFNNKKSGDSLSNLR